MESSIERIQLAEKFEEHDNDILFFFLLPATRGQNLGLVCP